MPKMIDAAVKEQALRMFAHHRRHHPSATALADGRRRRRRGGLVCVVRRHGDGWPMVVEWPRWRCYRVTTWTPDLRTRRGPPPGGIDDEARGHA